jgi:hypothetical protein
MTDMASDIVVYCDESGGDEHLVLAAVASPAKVWASFALAWEALLRREGLSEFKGSDCAHGVGEFRGRDKEARQHIHREFLGVIQGHHLNLVGVAVENAAWARLDRLFRPRVSEPGLSKQWLFTFGQLLLAIAHMCPGDAEVALLFDRQEEFEFKAQAGLRYLSQGTADPLLREFRVPESLRTLRDMNFVDSKEHAGIQAADALAYEFHLRLRDGHDPRASWTHTIPHLNTFLWGYIDQSAADLYAELVARLDERGLAATGVVDLEELAAIMRELPAATRPERLGDLASSGGGRLTDLPSGLWRPR